MRGALLAAAAAVAPGDPAWPRFHFARCAGEMNDPNGLQWRLRDGEPEYHLFFQARGGGLKAVLLRGRPSAALARPSF